MSSAWSVATPYNGTPDEREHIIRAAGVAAGQIMPELTDQRSGSGAIQVVPRGLIQPNCWQFKSTESAACSSQPNGDRTPTPAATGAGRYHPLYYAFVGWPVLLSPTWKGVLLARFISAGLASALLALAFVNVVRWSRNRVMLAGLLAAATPMALHMASAVNPNGLEIAAGIAFFASAIPLLLRDGHVPTGHLLWQVGISAVLLGVLRTSGPLWVVLGLFALLVPLASQRVRALWRSPAARWWSAAIVVALASSVLWIVVMKATNLGNFSGKERLSVSQAAAALADRWPGYLNEMIGVTSWLDARMPGPVYLVWQFSAASLLVWAFVNGRGVDRWRLLALTVGAVGIPSILQIRYANTTGFITQGRYILPALVGVVLLAAYVLGERGLEPDRSRFLVRSLAVILLPLHLVVLVYTMIRWQRGLPTNPHLRWLNPLEGFWHPPLGSLLPLVAATVGALVIGWLAWVTASESSTPGWLLASRTKEPPTVDGANGVQPKRLRISEPAGAPTLSLPSP